MPTSPDAPEASPQDPPGAQARPVRIVPMRPTPRPAEEAAARLAAAPAAAAVMPQLAYNGGPLLANVEITAVFWGSEWSDSPLSDLATQLGDYFGFLVTSPYMDQLAEYGVAGMPIGPGSFAGAVQVATPAPDTTTTDEQIQSFLQDEITAGSLPQPSTNSLYFVFTPPGVAVSLGGDLSCQVFCGYHDAIDGQIFYAVVPYPDCAGCQLGSTLDSLTVVASHELAEAVTDPIPGQGWYWFADANDQGEIGDICAGQAKTLGDYQVQLEWSNAAGGCV
jgi:hypothetical protein